MAIQDIDFKGIFTTGSEPEKPEDYGKVTEKNIKNHWKNIEKELSDDNLKKLLTNGIESNYTDLLGEIRALIPSLLLTIEEKKKKEDEFKVVAACHFSDRIGNFNSRLEPIKKIVEGDVDKKIRTD